MRKSILLYVIEYFNNVYGKPLDGRKKLQKLLFLIEHLDIKTEKIRKSTGLTGYTFKIWNYGPFSKEIYDDLDDAVKTGIVRETVRTWDDMLSLYTYIDDGMPRRMYYYEIVRVKRLAINLSSEIKNRVNYIVRRYGSLSPLDLESHVNKLLRLTPRKKAEYWGVSIDRYLEAEGLA